MCLGHADEQELSNKINYTFNSYTTSSFVFKMLLLLFPILSISLLLFLVYGQKLKINKATSPPGPRKLPLIGNLHQLNNNSVAPHVLLHQLSDQYGPLMSLCLGVRPAVVVSSAKMAKEIMKSHDLVFSDRPSLLGQYKLSYNGLDLAFSRHDKYNKEMRKACVLHFFSARKVRSFRSVREEEVSRMVQRLSKYELVNLSEVATSLASTIICRVAFGRSYEDGGKGRSRFHDLINEAEDLLESFSVSDYIPLMGWVDSLTGLISKMDKSFKESDMFYQEIMDSHLHCKPEHEDLVHVLLRMLKDKSFSVDLTLGHIKAMLMDIFVGGTYPIAATLVSAMRELMKNKRAMKRVQQEMRVLIGKDGFVREDDVHKLPYLKAVVKEALRMNPPIPLIPREATQNCTISGYVIEPKTLVFVNAWAIGRDLEAWENPREFNPERFMEKCIGFEGHDFELIPFGSGRRGCPGMHMGSVTVELALANLLYSFNWELPQEMNRQGINTNDLCLVALNHDLQV